MSELLPYLGGGAVEGVDRQYRQSASHRDLTRYQGRGGAGNQEHRIDALFLGKRAVERRFPIRPGKGAMVEEFLAAGLLAELDLATLGLRVAHPDRTGPRGQRRAVAGDDVRFERRLVREIDDQTKIVFRQSLPDGSSSGFGGG